MSTPFIGQISVYGFGFAPRTFAQANGQLLSIQQNAALFSLLGTTFGGNGVQTFALPDLRGRAPIGVDTQGQYVWGQRAGTETVNLNPSTMPIHNHLMNATTATGDNRSPVGGSFATLNNPSDPLYTAATSLTVLNPGNLGQTGGSQPHQNMQPYLVVNFCIALQGIFPSRN